MQASGAGENLLGLRIHRQRPLGEQEGGAVEKLDQRLGALLQARNRRAQLGALLLVELGCDLRPARQIGQGADERVVELRVARRAHVMAVDVLELGVVEARRRSADGRQIERGDELLGGEELLVAVTPAEPREIVAQRRRQIAHGAVGVDAERAMALGELGAVRPMNERDMRHRRNVPAEGLIDLGLPRGVGQMIVAANDVRHAHVVIVDDDREHIGRVAVRAQEHEVVEVLVGERDLALHLVVDDRLALLAGAEADDGRDAGGRCAGSRSRQRPS